MKRQDESAASWIAVKLLGLAVFLGAWSLALAAQSVDVAYEGVQKFLHTFLYFPEMCQEVYDCIRAKGGFASGRDLSRELGRKDRYGQGLLGRALVQLKAEGRIEEVKRSTGGRPAEGWEIAKDE